jgi:protein-arginine kinase activator protein McsA
MLCEICHQRKATVHVTKTVESAIEQGPGSTEFHFCDQCAETQLESKLQTKLPRDLIRLSDEYRATLFDLLEKTHPEAFDNHGIEACRRGSKLTREFLREQFKKDNIGVNDEVFNMLLVSFWSGEFYARAKKYGRKEG